MIKKFLSFSRKYFVIIFALSLIFVLIAPYLRSKTVYDDENLRDIRSGYPLGYVSTDFITGNAYESEYQSGKHRAPADRLYISFGFTGERNTIIWPLLFMSIVIMHLTFTLVFFAFSLIFLNA